MQTLVNIDWLSLSYSLELRFNEQEDLFLKCPDSWTIEHFSGTNIYQHRICYYNKFGEKMLTCLYFPKSKIIPKYMALVEVANKCLYSHEWEYIISNLSNIFHDGIITGISRLDLCCDFQKFMDENCLEKSAKNLLKKFESGQFAVLGKREGASFYSYDRSEEGKIVTDVKQLSFGSKTTQIKWKIYNKTREIQENSKTNEDYKKYILENWALNGFDVTKCTYRLECSINQFSSLCIGKNTNNYGGIAQLSQNYEKIFRTLYSENFKVILNEGKINISRSRRINILNLLPTEWQITKRPGISQAPIAEAKKVVSFHLKTLQDMGEVARCESAKYLWESVFSLVQEFGLYDWIEWKFEGADLQLMWECWLENTGKKSCNLFGL